MNADPTTLPAPVLSPGLVALLDRVADRQRADFGHMASDLKADGSLITACDRWSAATRVEGWAQLGPGEGVLSEEGDKTVPGSNPSGLSLLHIPDPTQLRRTR